MAKFRWWYIPAAAALRDMFGEEGEGKVEVPKENRRFEKLRSWRRRTWAVKQKEIGEE